MDSNLVTVTQFRGVFWVTLEILLYLNCYVFRYVGYTLGSRGYFFLIDISRRSRVNEAQSAEEKKITSGHRSTQPHFHARSGSNISPNRFWAPWEASLLNLIARGAAMRKNIPARKHCFDGGFRHIFLNPG